MSSLLKHRDQINAEGVVPSWLRGFWTTRLLYSIGLHVDVLADLLHKGVKARFPGYCATAMQYICRDRGLVRGPEETHEQIAERARTWQQDAKIKGNPIAVMRQLRAYLTPHSVTMRLVNNRGRYFETSPTGAVTWGDMTWNWDGQSLDTRFWLLLWVPSTLWEDEGTFADGGTVGDGGTIGSTALQPVVAGVRQIIRTWSSENSLHMHTIVIFDDAAWQSDQPTDGTWGRPSERNPNACYWPGDVST